MGLLTTIVSVALLFAVVLLAAISAYYNDILRRKVKASSSCSSDPDITTNKVSKVTPQTAGTIGLALNIVVIVLAIGTIALVVFLRGK